MKIFLFILSMTDASFAVLKDYEWNTIDACQAFVSSTDFTPKPGFVYVCGSGQGLKTIDGEILRG